MLGLHFKIILIIKTTKHIITLLLLLKQEIVRPFMKFHLNLCHAEFASVLVFDCFPMQSFGFFLFPNISVELSVSVDLANYTNIRTSVRQEG